MIQSIINSVTPLISNTDSIEFPTDSIRTRSSTCCGWLNHDEGSANYDILNGGIYEVDFSTTISSATAGVVALQLFKNGEPISGTLMAETLAAAGNYANVSANAKVQVCCRGDANISVRAVPAVPTATDPTTPIVTQVPIIANAIFSISRLA